MLKFVEENYPLPEKPELLPGLSFILPNNSHLYSLLCIFYIFFFFFDIGEDGVKELQRKRHSATPGVSAKGRVRKVAKWQPPSDAESDEESECEFPSNKVDESYVLNLVSIVLQLYNVVSHFSYYQHPGPFFCYVELLN